MATLFRSGPSTKATNLILGTRPNGYKPVVVGKKLKLKGDKCLSSTKPEQMDIHFHDAGILTPGVRATNGILGTVTQARFAHTDVVFPNFDDYRRESTKDPTKPARDSEDERRAFTGMMTYGVAAIVGLYTAKSCVQKIVMYKGPMKTSLALAAVEVDISSIPEGASSTVMWRGKPVFVRHRTQAEIDKEAAVNVSELRDPQHDKDRTVRPEWFVAIGVCTHLGCVPIANKGDYNGYYCPCHGSHYDTSGRIRKGPAPLNLEVPEHDFKSDTVLVVGKA